MRTLFFLKNRAPVVMTALVFLVLGVGVVCIAVAQGIRGVMGRQADGSFIVSSGQRIAGGAIAFPGRPRDIALHPNKDLIAVLAQNDVFLCSRKGVLARTRASLGLNPSGDIVDAGIHGILWTHDRRGANWTPDGMRFLVSTDQGYLQEVLYEDLNLFLKEKIVLTRDGDSRNAWPCGMCLTRDHKTVFVAAAGLDAVVEVDAATHKRVRDFPAQTLPYDVRLSDDEKTLIVTNWGGRTPRPGDTTAKSADEDIVVDKRGVAATGTLSLIDRATGETTPVDVGMHPCALTVVGNRAFIANAASDAISELDISARKIVRTISLHPGRPAYFGAMPNALAVRGNTLYICCGGDNAVAEMDIPSGTIRGYRPAGYYPCGMELTPDGKTAYVVNSKGNGSVENTAKGNPGNPHDFQGTITVLDLTKDLRNETALVARNNRWNIDPNANRPKHPVYNGAAKHVLYIIKENQTYDSIFGDMKEGNGDPSLCIMGEMVMPNHRAMARQFTLFDNGYVSGTNSADGHAWSTQSIANDYMERVYGNNSRTYSDDGDCAMSLSAGGGLWDAAAKKGKKIRVYGEFCDDRLARYEPRRPKDWFEAWEDYKSGRHFFKYTTDTRIPSLQPFICPTVHYWPLIQSDQSRADEFLKEYAAYSRTDTVPDLMILTLVCDHGSGLDPEFPTIRAMQADNDLAFGRVIDAVTHSPQWKDTIIFVIEDDGQASPDHVDGHRSVFMVLSPYVKRHAVDSTLYTTVDMLRSMELILGLDPMTRFDARAKPITTCFADKPDLTPYNHVRNNIALDERNPGAPGGPPLTAADAWWLKKSRSLDWSRIDGADPYWYSRIQWRSLTGGKRPFPLTPGQPQASVASLK